MYHFQNKATSQLRNSLFIEKKRRQSQITKIISQIPALVENYPKIGAHVYVNIGDKGKRVVDLLKSNKFFEANKFHMNVAEKSEHCGVDKGVLK